MNKIFLLLVTVLLAAQIYSQPVTRPVQLDSLISEAMKNNPEIQAALAQVDVMRAKVSQAGTLDDPELKFMQEGMPDFKFNEAMFSRLELMQMVPFPTKLGTQKDLSVIQKRFSQSDQLEKVNEVLAKLKSTYVELWFIQQNIAIAQENSRLMKQFLSIAQTKYTAGQVPQQDILKAQIEISMIGNEQISFRQKELSMKAMMMSLLNRDTKDTISIAVIPSEVSFSMDLDSVLSFALHNRPMIIKDSLMIDESKTMLSMAKQEYLPDFKFGIERMTEPMGSFTGWSVSAGITLPFAPWTLGKASTRVDEANAAIIKSNASYTSTRNMVASNVKDLYYKASGAKKQLDIFNSEILPQAKQSVQASLTAYQTGTTDFLMLIDAYRTLVNLSKEYFMTRMQFEQAIAELEREAGTQYLSDLK
ncbi:MAG: TolC family protein [Ignavibacteriales bacterium]|nr:TolC family protein [Ignavibacteriales bacterium]